MIIKKSNRIISYKPCSPQASKEITSPPLFKDNSLDAISHSAFFYAPYMSGQLILPEGLLSIGGLAFYRLEELTGELRIPNSVIEIGVGAFESCSEIESLILPPSLHTIEKYTFGDMTKLKSIKFSEGLRIIKPRAFYRCISLGDEITLPKSLKILYLSAFKSCRNVDKINIYKDTKVYVDENNYLKEIRKINIY